MLFGLITSAGAQRVQVYETTGNGEEHFLEPQRSLLFGSTIPAAETNLTVDESLRFQRIRALGVPPPCHTRSFQSENTVPSSDAPATINWEPDSLTEEAEKILLVPLAAGATSIRLRYQASEDDPRGPCRSVLEVDGDITPSRSDLDFKILMHAANFVSSGAYRIASVSNGSQLIDTVAFRAANGPIVLLTLNKSPKPVTFNVYWNGRAVAYTQASHALTTLVWDPRSPMLSVYASPGSANVQQGEAVSFSLSVHPQPMYAPLPPLELACTGAPPEATCSVTPERIAGSSETAAVIRIATSAPRSNRSTDSSGIRLSYGVALLPGCLLGMLAAAKKRRRRTIAVLMLSSMIACLLTLANCGGVPSDGGTPEGRYTLIVTATPEFGATSQTRISLEVRRRRIRIPH